VGLDLCCEPSTAPRKTKVVCTLGPACWSEEGLAQLLDAGCDVARFNFSHGSHEGHQEVCLFGAGRAVFVGGWLGWLGSAAC
jgi:pyruvate kinase